MTADVKVGMKLDFQLLREQKTSLIEVMQSAELTHDQALHLEGILEMIDHIQDCAAEQIGEPDVFGPDSETETPG